MRTLILGLAAALSVTAAQAATYRLGGLEVGQPWSRDKVSYCTALVRSRTESGLISRACAS